MRPARHHSVGVLAVLLGAKEGWSCGLALRRGRWRRNGTPGSEHDRSSGQELEREAVRQQCWCERGRENQVRAVALAMQGRGWVGVRVICGLRHAERVMPITTPNTLVPPDLEENREHGGRKQKHKAWSSPGARG